MLSISFQKRLNVETIKERFKSEYLKKKTHLTADVLS